MQVCMSISEPGRLLCSLRYCGAPLPKHIEIQQSSFDHYIYRYQGGVKQVHPNLLPVPTALLGGKCSFPIFPLQSVAFVSFYCFWYKNGSPGKGENILFWHLLAILLSLFWICLYCALHNSVEFATISSWQQQRSFQNFLWCFSWVENAKK